MAENIFRGKAQISGVRGTVTCNAAAWSLLKESAQLTHTFDEDIVKSEVGGAASWKSSDERDEGSVGFRLVDTGTPSSEANIETFCAALGPYAAIVFTGFKPARFNGSYQLISGSDYNLSNVSAGTGSMKLRKYVDATQQALSVLPFVPSA